MKIVITRNAEKDMDKIGVADRVRIIGIVITVIQVGDRKDIYR